MNAEGRICSIGQYMFIEYLLYVRHFTIFLESKIDWVLVLTHEAENKQENYVDIRLCHRSRIHLYTDAIPRCYLWATKTR